MTGLDHVTIREIAQALGVSKSQAERRAAKAEWPFDEVAVKGGRRRLYPLPTLPEDVRDALINHLISAGGGLLPPASPATSPAGDVSPSSAGTSVAVIGDTTHLTNAQRATMDARMAVLAHVDHLARLLGGLTRARLRVVEAAKAGTLPEGIAKLLPVANAKSGKAGGRTVSPRTLINWHNERASGAAALAPKVPQPDMSIPAWGPALMAVRNYQGRSLHDIITVDLSAPGALPPGVAPPSYGQARRWLDKVSSVERGRTRMGPKELKSIKPYVRRDLSGLDPLDVVQSDGHCLDAEVLHPRHGHPFRPEMTSIIDLATRMCVGWSAGLAENALGVTEAIVYMVTRWGIPAVWYVDNGSGYNNQLMDDERTGLLARIQTTKLNRLPNNPQAGGYVERSHQSIWIKGAKRLPAYMGKDMDRQAGKLVHKISRAEIKQAGTTRHMMAWPEFLAWAEALVQEYNNTPHRGLPRITDPVTGRRRHMTPAESWAEAVARGWSPALVSAAEAADLTRPYEIRTVTRGMVSVLGNSYFSRVLADWHGHEVMVGYDVHDASMVYVRDMDGRLICEAGFEANKRAVLPRSYLDAAVERRQKGRIKRAMEHVKEIHAEAGIRIVDGTAQIVPDNVVALKQHLMLEMAAAPAATAAPIPETAASRYERWRALDAALTAGAALTDDERRWHQRYPLSAEYRAMSDMAAGFGQSSGIA